MFSFLFYFVLPLGLLFLYIKKINVFGFLVGAIAWFFFSLLALMIGFNPICLTLWAGVALGYFGKDWLDNR